MKATDVNINQTESIRIAGELNRWIGGGKTLNWTYDVPRKKRQTYLSEEKINGKLFFSLVVPYSGGTSFVLLKVLIY